MKLVFLPLFSFGTLVLSERVSLGLKPYGGCASITQPQANFWVAKGSGQEKLRFEKDCENPGSDNSKCIISCKRYDTPLIMDRGDESKWDRSFDPKQQKKFLVKCKCEAYQETDGSTTFENCRWKPRRFWSEQKYRDEWDLNNGEGRMRRSAAEPKATFYCEDDTPAHIRETWNLKTKTDRTFPKDKGFEDCGNMYDIFPLSGGEWRCRSKTPSGVDGEWIKNDADATALPHKAVCSWGCGSGDSWEAKDARFVCMKPWIARPTSKWEDKDIWRRFVGMGVRVFKQGLLDCSYHE